MSETERKEWEQAIAEHPSEAEHFAAANGRSLSAEVLADRLADHSKIADHGEDLR